MIEPAFEDFVEDPELSYPRWCVYLALRKLLSFDEPREVKVAVIRHLANVGMGPASEALAWLERRGYVVVHHRDGRGTPTLTLAYERRGAAA